MRDALRGIVLGLVLLALVGAIASRAGWGAISVPRPAGTGPWLLARASGYAAFVALSLDVMAGLLVSTRVGDRWMTRGQLIDVHGWLSPLALALLVGHVLALLADRYIRFDVLDVLVPGLSPYRPVAVGLGIVAAYCAVVVHASFGFRRRIGTKAWRRLHYLSFVAFCAAAAHAFLAGTDASRAWAIVICAVPLLGAAVLLARRLRTLGRPAGPVQLSGPVTRTAQDVRPSAAASL
jgi:DMSO/TMAO reductase YedYZ heme-binding membrane subunit